MRKLVYAMNVTADGCCDHTKGMADAELHKFYTDLLQESDTFVYGRKTYDLMVPFWPDMAKTNSGETKDLNDFAHAFHAVKKILVFSKTLKSVDYEKATVVSSGLKEEVEKLKQQDGKKIMTGGVDVPAQLIQFGLVDEFYIVVQPLVVGEGRRLFDDVTLQENLKLIDVKTLDSGSVVLRYAKA